MKSWSEWKKYFALARMVCAKLQLLAKSVGILSNPHRECNPWNAAGDLHKIHPEGVEGVNTPDVRVEQLVHVENTRLTTRI